MYKKLIQLNNSDDFKGKLEQILSENHVLGEKDDQIYHIGDSTLYLSYMACKDNTAVATLYCTKEMTLESDYGYFISCIRRANMDYDHLKNIKEIEN